MSKNPFIRSKPHSGKPKVPPPPAGIECLANEPTFTLSRQVARARAEMGEARWSLLNAEWL
jgi:hypothetical protein